MIPDNIEKINRSQFVTYLDTTPSSSSETWKILGIGITDYSVAYNPQVDTEKWIIEDNARSDHTSNQKQSSISQKMYKNDPCFEFIANGRDKLNYVTHILDIDRYNGNNGVYPAKYSDGKIAITKWGGENAVVEADIYYDGDVKEGTVTFDATGTPSFTETPQSL